MNTPETKQWTVLDLNAKAAPRIHEIPIKTDDSGEVVITKSYTLNADTATAMDEEHAMFFLKDPAFIVCNEKGDRVEPVTKREGGTGGFELGADEVIASYEELSKEALFKRCKVIAGSEYIKETRTAKGDMIAFLKARAKPTIGRSRGSEGVIGEADTKFLDTLLPN
jgi:predicted peroxiredoxin